MFQFNLAHLPNLRKAEVSARRGKGIEARACAERKRHLNTAMKSFVQRDDLRSNLQLASNAMRARTQNYGADGRGQYVGGSDSPRQ